MKIEKTPCKRETSARRVTGKPNAIAQKHVGGFSLSRKLYVRTHVKITQWWKSTFFVTVTAYKPPHHIK